ncbi:MAG TPA: aminopeptidase P family protein [Micromonosporaceae bacterium]|jgi:Xaa-Pro aminopeptidase|nr:aminopeptidase P family protein [Micromonosporaceae bacterium]
MNDPEQTAPAHHPEYPEPLLEFMRTGWRDKALDGLAPLDQAPCHARRRDQLSAAFPGETLVIPTGTEKVRNNDCFYPFRPGSDFIWLTGEHDPDAVLVMRPNGNGHDSVLYARPRSPKETDEFFRDPQYGELWIGRRHSLVERATLLGIETGDLTDLDKALADLGPASTRVLRGYDSGVDTAVEPVGTQPETLDRDSELAAVLSELRRVKDEWEIEQLADAVRTTVLGFEDVARVLPATGSVSERLLDGVFGLRARHDGNTVGYGSIVAAGPHATTLHWIRNDGRTRPGELLLMDMGVENRNLYTADVTRTLPVSGRFTDLQREIYQIVYASQQAGIEAVRPGVRFREINRVCMRVLAEGLESLGLLPCSAEESLDPGRQLHRRWTLHGFGHMLGLDVHDCASARRENYRDGTVEEGFVITVEPGLYFQTEDELVPEELRGIGIRIEDDVLVTSSGAEVLSMGLPRKADEVEDWLARQREAGPRLPD